MIFFKKRKLKNKLTTQLNLIESERDRIIGLTQRLNTLRYDRDYRNKLLLTDYSAHKKIDSFKEMGEVAVQLRTLLKEILSDEVVTNHIIDKYKVTDLFIYHIGTGVISRDIHDLRKQLMKDQQLEIELKRSEVSILNILKLAIKNTIKFQRRCFEIKQDDRNNEFRAWVAFLYHALQCIDRELANIYSKQYQEINDIKKQLKELDKK